MTSTRSTTTPIVEADQVPWYDLIDDVPEPPEDGMQQYDAIIYILQILGARYAHDPDVLVAGSAVFIVYDSNTPGSTISPDAFVVFGVPEQIIKRDNRLYRIEEWGPPPIFVAEVASDSTANWDMTGKREIYAQMGAREYWRFDPSGGERYGEPLIGERLVGGEYVRFELQTESNGDIWARSEALGLDFYWRVVESGYGEFLIRDSETGEWLENLSEEREVRIAAEARAQLEQEGRIAAEARARSEREGRIVAEARAQEAEAELEKLRRSGGR